MPRWLLLLLLTLCTLSLARAFTQDEFVLHVKEVAAHAGITLTGSGTGHNDLFFVAGTYAGTVEQLRAAWEQTARSADKVTVTATPDGEWMLHENGNGYFRLFHTSDFELYSAHVWPKSEGCSLSVQLLPVTDTPLHEVADFYRRMRVLPLLTPEGRKYHLDLRVSSNLISPDSRRVAIAGRDGTISLVDVRTAAVLRRWNAHDGQGDRYIRMAYSQDGRLLASVGDDGAVKVWDAETGALLTTVIELEERNFSDAVCFDPTGRYLAVALDGTSTGGGVYDLRTGTWVRRFAERKSCLDWSPDGRFLAVGNHKVQGYAGTVVLETTGFSVIHKHRDEHNLTVQQIRFSPDSRLLLIDEFAQCHMLDTKDWSVRYTVRDIISSATAFTSDSAYLLLKIYADDLIVLDARSGEWLCRLLCNAEEAINVSADGTVLAMDQYVWVMREGTVADAITRFRTVVARQPADLGRIAALAKAGKLPPERARVATTAIREGRLSDHPALAQFLEGAISEAQFLAAFR
jgi:dipeptidyl aminopeptidase/acylaminoacyl peptidase